MKPSEFIKEYNTTDCNLEYIEKKIDKHFIDKDELIKRLDNMIEFRDNERINNNIFRKSQDDLNEDFIDVLKQFKEDIQKQE